ncbi:MAG TPA: Uma2 family endonuclease [Gemmata sp.]|jgi:Uma2 family endonuclease|nr:Uma2 family endonuclease [Gemmata sp.]
MNSAARVTKKPKPGVPLPPAIPTQPVRRFTVDEYHRMLEAGVLKEREPYELINGWIIRKMVVYPPHNYAVNVLMELFMKLHGSGATLRIQQPITTANSEPEPDVVVAAGSVADYATRNPNPSEVHVLVEVAESSLQYDRTTKLELYAKAKIQVYWIVNLIDRRVEVYTGPRGGKKPTYKQQKNYGPGDEVPLFIGGKEVGRIPVKELFYKGNRGEHQDDKSTNR